MKRVDCNEYWVTSQEMKTHLIGVDHTDHSTLTHDEALHNVMKKLSCKVVKLDRLDTKDVSLMKFRIPVKSMHNDTMTSWINEMLRKNNLNTLYYYSDNRVPNYSTTDCGHHVHTFYMGFK